MKNFGYWLFGADMNKVNLETLKKNGVTDIFLNYYAFTAHGQSKVESWIKKAKNNNINVHIWVQCFYDGEWHNPKTYDLTAKLKEIKKYAGITNVTGIHLDYLRYPGTAYKTSGGAEAITDFVKKVRKQNPNTFLSCAVMPETECKKYYGQDIEALGKTVDAIIPMQYKGNYKAGTDWLKSTTKFFSNKAKIWSGLQTYKSDDNPVSLSSTEILNDAKTCINNGAKGIILFRYGLSVNVNFTSLQDKTTTKSTGISASNIKTLATTVKKYIETNKKSPSTVTVDNVKYTWPQIWYIFSWHVNNLGKNLSEVQNVKTCSKATGDNIKEDIYPSDFKDQSKRVVQYIKQNGQAPNFVTSVKSKKKIRPRVSIDALARIIVWYYGHDKTLPNYCTYNSSRFTASSSSSSSSSSKSNTSSSNNCENPYTSSPHYLNQGAGALGQITPYDCGPHCIHQGLKKFGVTNISESELIGYCGTTTSGTSHDGLETGIAKAAKKAGIKIKVTWKNFSELGKTDEERFKALGELMCKKNTYVFSHIWYSCAGECIDDDDACGHYETFDKINIKTGYLRILNSLGARQGNGYLGHLQDRKFSIQSHYIKGISQKSICIMTKV